MMVATRNLSTIMQMTIGIGGSICPQRFRGLLQTAWIHFERLLSALDRLVAALVAHLAEVASHRRLIIRRSETHKMTWDTGC